MATRHIVHDGHTVELHQHRVFCRWARLHRQSCHLQWFLVGMAFVWVPAFFMCRVVGRGSPV